MRRFISFGLAFLLISALALAQVKPEVEPNDKREQAQEIRIGDTISGSFEKDANHDWYKLVVDTAGKREIQIDLSGVAGVDSGIRIEDKTGRELWMFNHNPKGEGESVPFFVVTEGFYYIHVEALPKNVTDNYTLSVRLLGPWQENWEAEPNREFQDANELRLDTPLKGRVNGNYDIDCYFLKVAEPGPDLVLIQMSGIPGDLSDVELFNEKQKKVAGTIRGELGSGCEIVRMRVQPGTYYLKITLPRKGKSGSEYTLYAGKALKPPASPGEVQQALIKALEWLAKKQQKNGNWPGGD
jgi:hypothetical protein